MILRLQLRFFLFWIAAGCLEFPFLQSFFLASAGPLEDHFPSALLMHLGAVTILSFSISRRTLGFRGQTLWPSTLAHVTLLIPFLGWVASGVLFLEIMRERPGEVLEKDLTMFVPEDGEVMVQTTRESIPRRVSRELDFVPLVDILRSEDVEMKRGAIERLAEFESPEAIEILLGHRSDPSADVRFYVTAALARVKREFDEELDAAKQAMRKDVTNVQARIFLARTYLQYAQSRLLDEVTVDTYEREAMYHLQFAVQSPEASSDAFRMLVNLHRKRLEWAEAVKVLDALQNGKGEGALFKIQILYESGDHREVAAELKRLKEAGRIPPDWVGLANWWSSI